MQTVKNNGAASTSGGGPGWKPAEWAEFWRVNLRTAQRWSIDGVPAHDVGQMLAWFVSQGSGKKSRMAVPFKQRIAELRGNSPATPIASGENSAPNLGADPDWAEFEKAAPTEPGASHQSDSAYLVSLKRQRDFAVFKLNRAQARNDLSASNDASALLKLISPIIHDEELRALKLNRELGETVPVAELDRTTRALAFWLMRSADAFLSAACRKVADSVSSAGPTSPEDIRQILEPLTLTHRVLDPFARATKSQTGMSLSPRIVAAMKAAVDEFLENGGQQFEEARQ